MKWFIFPAPPSFLISINKIWHQGFAESLHYLSLKYNQFHSFSVFSPTWQSFMSCPNPFGTPELAGLVRYGVTLDLMVRLSDSLHTASQNIIKKARLPKERTGGWTETFGVDICWLDFKNGKYKPGPISECTYVQMASFVPIDTARPILSLES